VGHIFNHNGCLDCSLRSPADCEYTMIFHQDGCAGSNRS
jgi:hypothetical protein